MLLEALHLLFNLWSGRLKWDYNSIKSDWTSSTQWIIVSPKGVLFLDLWHETTQVNGTKVNACIRILSHKRLPWSQWHFPVSRTSFPPPPVTQRSWMPFGGLSSVHRGHGTGLELEGLFIFFMCWTMFFSGCERSFLAFKNDPKEKTLLTKTAFAAEPFQKFTSFQMMHSSQREYSFKHWIVF